MCTVSLVSSQTRNFDKFLVHFLVYNKIYFNFSSATVVALYLFVYFCSACLVLLDYAPLIVKFFLLFYHSFTDMFCSNALGELDSSCPIFQKAARERGNADIDFTVSTIMGVKIKIQFQDICNLTWRLTRQCLLILWKWYDRFDSNPRTWQWYCHHMATKIWNASSIKLWGPKNIYNEPSFRLLDRCIGSTCQIYPIWRLGEYYPSIWCSHCNEYASHPQLSRHFFQNYGLLAAAQFKYACTAIKL